MNSQEAYNILGVSPGIPEDELKKAYRKKASELHPDVNKAENAEEKFKELNAAYELLQKPPPVNKFDVNYTPFDFTIEDFSPGRDFDPFFKFRGNFRPSGFRYQNPNFFRVVETDPIIITFEESILGCSKETTVRWGSPCDTCHGNRIVEGNKCLRCDGSGINRMETAVSLNVHPGTINGEMFNLQVSNNVHAKVVINVLPDHAMRLEGRDVISVLDISLLEALKGTSRKVRTIKGERSLKIKPGVKNRDPVRVSGFGVPPYGSHIFLVNVKYPDNLQPLVEFLEKNQEPAEEIKGESDGI